ncbi:hypothetical protein PFICI_14644 [Pestalotiopsis fici W106-1]|uniref:Major facilitator superfamily (MFS) profile domain-containing protein n=1 Tax=Pestalotiopsis fici (strain W106-1 / CGMCC3.15140) TaxID=1229662 RepID=W3WII6_PESFW|nr:uncharacterized protein PFICI_14644 [Pestalotiopsis fici W106-1]ETS73698.1 hypothetical protein PFICI_14644 [Pestalotiopsis fici W106-1]
MNAMPKQFSFSLISPTNSPNDWKQDVDAEKDSALERVLIHLQQDDLRLRQLFDTKVLPYMTMTALMLGIKSVAIVQADLFGLTESMGFSTTQSSCLHTAPHLPQILLQLPVAWILLDSIFPLDKFLGACLVLIGCRQIILPDLSFTGAVLTGLLQGVFEVVFVPALVWMTWVYWTREEMPTRLSWWYSMIGFGNLTMSVITYFLVERDATIRPDVVILCCSCFVFCVYMFITCIFCGESPLTLKFLSDREEKVAWAVQRLTAPRNISWSDAAFEEAKKDVRTWLWFGLTFISSLLIAGSASISQRFLISLATDSSRALSNLPFGAIQFIAAFCGGLATTKLRFGTVLIALSCISSTGLLILHRALQQPVSSTNFVLAGHYLAASVHASVPIVYSWSGVNTAGATQKKATLAFMSMGYALGHVCGPFMLMPSSNPQSSSAMIWAMLSLHVLFIILVFILMNHFNKMNRRHGGSVKAEQIIGNYDPRLYMTIDFDLQQQKLSNLA